MLHTLRTLSGLGLSLRKSLWMTAILDYLLLNGHYMRILQHNILSVPVNKKLVTSNKIFTSIGWVENCHLYAIFRYI